MEASVSRDTSSRSEPSGTNTLTSSAKSVMPRIPSSSRVCKYIRASSHAGATGAPRHRQ